jgi:hypothetical protein
MKTLGLILAVTLQVSLAPLWAAPPANDGFSNRFAIVSSPTVVTTSLAEATFDPPTPEWNEQYYNAGGYPYTTGGIGSLWWTVTLTNACSFTIEFLEASSFERLTAWGHAWYGYWASGAGPYTSAQIGRVPYLTIWATNGIPKTLNLQLTGKSPQVVLRFTTHTVPLILTPPQSRTVSPGESVFFGVSATGHKPLQYQWLHNGQPIAGAVYPILSFDNVTSSNAGNYQVLIMDDLGTNSADVTLTVSQTNVPPRWLALKRLSANEWSGSLEVEAGRSYRIESSTNLADWSPVARVVQESSVRYGTVGIVSNSGVVFLPNANSDVRFTTASPHEFFRAVRYEPPHSECHNNLKKIRFAKELWSHVRLDGALSSPPDDNDLFGAPPHYMSHYPWCPPPFRGIYTKGPLVVQPECNVHSPLLEPSW